MESPTPFDLNVAIRKWREHLAASPAVRAADVDELESHLRDAVAHLRSKGLSEPEAFWIGQSRLGGPELIHEFAKINQSQVWMDRAMWMVVGVSIYCLASGLADALATFLPIVPALFQQLMVKWELVPAGAITGLPYWAYFSGVLARPFLLTGLLWAAWAFMRRPGQKSRAKLVFAQRHPIVSGVAILLVSVVTSTASMLAQMISIRFLSISDMAALSKWQLAGASLHILMPPVAIALILARLKPKTPPPAPSA